MSDLIQSTVHGFLIIGSFLTGRVDPDTSKRARIILVDRGESYPDRWVTAFQWTGDPEWSNGNYMKDLNRALDDFARRVRAEMGLKQPWE